MTMPRFTAEASIDRSEKHYKLLGSPDTTTESIVVPAKRRT